MKTYLDCIPCFMRQALFAARAATQDEGRMKAVLDRVGLLLPQIPLEHTPPETGRRVYRAVAEVTGVLDPFEELKARSIAKALTLYPELKAEIAASPEPLGKGIRLAIAGNAIDFAANPDFEIEREIDEALVKPFAVDDSGAFLRSLSGARHILYLADNAGETVFDRILIETLGKPVVYAVRDAPIINDATLADAMQSGLDRVSTVISSGCDAPGIVLEGCSETFRGQFHRADLIISKGQGNYECLSGVEGPIFFLLKVKCPVVARHLGAEVGDLVLKGPEVP